MASPSRFLPLALAALLLAPLLGSVALPSAVADSVGAAAALPSARAGTSAVWTGEAAFVFGGATAGGMLLAEAVRFVPGTGEVDSLGNILPSPRSHTGSAWTGTAAFIVGGKGATGPVADILRFDPAAGAAVLVASLPSPRSAAAVVWTGTHVVALGGFDASGTAMDEIVAYDPASNAVQVLPSTLPSGRGGAAAVFTGEDVLLFGGDLGGTFTGEFVRFRPTSTAVEVVEGTFFGGAGRAYATAAWRDGHAYVLGGLRQTGEPTGEIFRYRPGSPEQVTLMSAGLPSGHANASGIAEGAGLLVFGGWKKGFPAPTLSASILRYSLAPGAPRAATATAGPGVGEATVTWSAPSSATYTAPLTSYRVFRSIGGGPEVLAGETAALSFTDGGLPPGASVTYHVVAVNSDGVGDRTGPLTVTTYGAPAPPRDLEVTSQPAPSVAPGVSFAAHDLRWEAPASDGGRPVETYRVYRAVGGADGVLLAATGIHREYRDDTCPVLETCRYVVTAVNAVGESAASNEVAARGTRIV